jgi:hypothetical protein
MMELGAPAMVPVADGPRESAVVSEKYACPCCGYLIEVPGRAKDAAPEHDAVHAVIVSMDREIRQLRETVAMLRGARAG